MFRSKRFLIEELGIGPRSREDTCLILGMLFDEIKNEGVTDEIIGEFLFLRGYINKNRGLIKNKDYDIICLSTFLGKANLILEKYGMNKLSLEEISEINEKVKKKQIQEIKINVDILFDEDEDENIVDKAYKMQEKKKEIKDINDCTGIYGIYVEDKLVYIGRTIESFAERYRKHIQKMKTCDAHLYKQLRNYKEAGYSVFLKPLIVLESLEMENKRSINVKELNCMEMALITVLQPELNVEGKLKPYVFRNH